MTPEEQRIAIGEACGAKWHLNATMASRFLSFTSSRPVCLDYSVPLCDDWPEDIPDYLNDLNAMHETEKVYDVYSYPQRERYLDNLMAAVKSEGKDRPFCCATASQRAEAFLRTIGKWE